MQYVESYMQRLAELVLTGMGSEVLSCCISSTAICVEVRHPTLGGRGHEWVVGNCLGDSLGGTSPGDLLAGSERH